MATKWSRERVLREILSCENAGRSLTVGGRDGVSQALYQAGTRIFGSWKHALSAAGVAANRSKSYERWSPGRILSIIRGLARRGRPLGVGELKSRYAGCLVPAARRCFGSWNRAVIAAGVNPLRLKRVPAWTQERVLEAILTRVLDGEPVESRTVQPGSLAAAGAKFFGTWAAALKAAGLNPDDVNPAAVRTSRSLGPAAGNPFVCNEPRTSRHPRKWPPERVLIAIRQRVASGQEIRASVMYREDSALLSAARRRFGNWSKALAAADLGLSNPRSVASTASPPVSAASLNDPGD